jgi:hypothetical protein
MLPRYRMMLKFLSSSIDGNWTFREQSDPAQFAGQPKIRGTFISEFPYAGFVESAPCTAEVVID